MAERTKQIKVRFPPDTHKLISSLANLQSPPRTFSDVVVGLCEEALKPPNVMDRDAIATRLGALEQKVKGVRLDIETLGELLSLFVFNWCCHTPSVPDNARQLAVTEGSLRFKEFLNVLQKRLLQGELTLPRAGISNDKQDPRTKAA